MGDSQQPVPLPAPLRVLICGCGIAGPSLAFWLLKLHCNVTIVERSAEIRASGQQIDLRGQGVEIMKLMGIEKAVRAKVVNEEGVQFIDSNGKRRAYIPANKTGKGKQSATSEFEIMRGDLSNILYDLVKGKVKTVFGTYVINFEQRDEVVHVNFSDGTEGTFDLVVGADGQNSKTRRLLLAADGAPDPFRPFDMYWSYFRMAKPQQPGEVNVASAYHAGQRKVIIMRRDNPHSVQIYLESADAPNHAEVAQAIKGPIKGQKEAFANLFRDAGWDVKRILEGMKTSDEFYAHAIGQVHLDSWYRGRVVLLGDAAYCPSPLTGMGTSLAMIGPYVLAGEISKCSVAQEQYGDMTIALKAWEDCLRPYVAEASHVSPWLIKAFFLDSRIAVWILHTVIWLITTFKLNVILEYFFHGAVDGWELPIYPALF